MPIDFLAGWGRAQSPLERKICSPDFRDLKFTPTFVEAGPEHLEGIPPDAPLNHWRPETHQSSARVRLFAVRRHDCFDLATFCYSSRRRGDRGLWEPSITAFARIFFVLAMLYAICGLLLALDMATSHDHW